MRALVHRTVLEKFLLTNPQWHAGYQDFLRDFPHAYAWLCLLDEGKCRPVRLDRKGRMASHAAAGSVREESGLLEIVAKMMHDEKKVGALPSLYGERHREKGVVFAIRHFGRLKAFLFLSRATLTNPLTSSVLLFNHFLASQVELAYKNFELNNFYETVHPRALALSTIHSVHRVISSSLRLQDLLPRIGRLSAQVLKAQGCAIMLVDPDHEYLMPYFSYGDHPRLTHTQRVRIGRGIQGKIAATGEYYLRRNAVAVPFIEEDIVGVIALWSKLDGQPFTKIDLEILKSLSEQAVVAIKNARLFEETERLTLGSIQTINDLLELSFGGDRSQLPVFGKIVIEIGKEMGLSSRDLLHLDRAILLLDTGALALSGNLLQKKEKLTKKELAQIRRIPSKGANLLRSISSLRPIIPIILHHHERFDGKGYPQGLSGEQIPIGARIVSVVDSFIAMISKRSYRDRMSADNALAEIESNRNTQFDPRVVDCFLKVMKRKDIRDQLENMRLKGKAVSIR